MNYELAKELKDAGFPQGFPVPNDVPSITGIWFDKEGERVYQPTLSELIEACGDKYISLEERSPEAEEWAAYKRDMPNGGQAYYGSTPEEAVARLWLALNKK